MKLVSASDGMAMAAAHRMWMCVYLSTCVFFELRLFDAGGVFVFLAYIRSTSAVVCVRVRQGSVRVKFQTDNKL